jgi:hypothetical protein
MAPRRLGTGRFSMNAAIIDTDVVSMLFKGDSRVRRYRDHI